MRENRPKRRCKFNITLRFSSKSMPKYNRAMRKHFLHSNDLKTQLHCHYERTFDRKTLRGSFSPEIYQAAEWESGGETRRTSTRRQSYQGVGGAERERRETTLQILFQKFQTWCHVEWLINRVLNPSSTSPHHSVPKLESWKMNAHPWRGGSSLSLHQGQWCSPR